MSHTISKNLQPGTMNSIRAVRRLLTSSSRQTTSSLGKLVQAPLGRRSCITQSVQNLLTRSWMVSARKHRVAIACSASSCATPYPPPPTKRGPKKSSRKGSQKMPRTPQAPIYRPDKPLSFDPIYQPGSPGSTDPVVPTDIRSTDPVVPDLPGR
jgi:hypothetical protein